MYVSFFDTSQAFDRVNHTVLLRILLRAGIVINFTVLDGYRSFIFWFYCF